MTSSADYWTTAREVCTPDELLVLQLAEQTDRLGQPMGRRRIALILGIAPTTARDRLNRARQKVDLALKQETAV